MTSSERPRSGESSPGGRPDQAGRLPRGAAAAVAGGVAFRAERLRSAAGAAGAVRAVAAAGTAASTGSGAGAALYRRRMSPRSEIPRASRREVRGQWRDVEDWRCNALLHVRVGVRRGLRNGAKLAAAHIKQLGGPNIDIRFPRQRGQRRG